MGDLGTGARRKTRIGRPRSRVLGSHDVPNLPDRCPSLGRGVPPPGIRFPRKNSKYQKRLPSRFLRRAAERYKNTHRLHVQNRCSLFPLRPAPRQRKTPARWRARPGSKAFVTYLCFSKIIPRTNRETQCRSSPSSRTSGWQKH
ncbi:hypothetical protein Ga0080574_TMP1829 [Salipiger abyssi]|uniref:Uncharacterized protein n=1 Tax=Salipiger abyssi TaxID=1250539 RepID=A0A1P8URY2_9RHOB|nr:hypothetical protein Ga0080574_TMP1829 [Salipiger abyssi]